MFESALINGKLIGKSDFCSVSILSPSFQYGLNVFEGIRAYPSGSGLHTFLLTQHIERLLSSANLLGIQELPSEEQLYEDIACLIPLLDPQEYYYLKFMIGYLGMGSWHSVHSPDRILFAYPVKSCFKESKAHLAKCKFSSITRISQNSLPPRIKVGANYINSRLAYLDVNSTVENGSYLPIILNQDGSVSESSGSTIFCLHNNILSTPSLSSGILPSITRSHLINNIVHKIDDLHVHEAILDRWDLLSSNCLFLAGTNAELTFVSQLNDTMFKPNTIFDSIFLYFKNTITEL